MARLNVLDYTADFIRGWPHGEAVEMNYPTLTGTDPVGNGSIVKIVAGGVQSMVGETPAATDTLAIVARGTKDTFAEGGTGRGNLYKQVVPNIVILSNYVVRTSNVDAANIPAAGAPVYVDSLGRLTSVAGTSPVFGTSLEDSQPVTNTDGVAGTAIVVLVK